MRKEKNGRKPKILVFDIETAPMEAYVWGLYDQNVGLNQVKKDWAIIAWAAKWVDGNKVIYMDTRNKKDPRDDKQIVKELIKLFEQADLAITHNGDKFDFRKVYARALVHGLPPSSKPRSTDTYKESRKVFGLTSHKLEYMSEIINKKYKKLKHNNYPGMELWKAALSGDKKAWKEMEEYNANDVLATEELFLTLRGWIKMHNMSNIYDDAKLRCLCGSSDLYKKGFIHTDNGKFQGYKCRECGRRPRSRVNLLPKEDRRRLLR